MCNTQNVSENHCVISSVWYTTTSVFLVGCVIERNVSYRSNYVKLEEIIIKNCFGVPGLFIGVSRPCPICSNG